jgi:hypothetical protein
MKVIASILIVLALVIAVVPQFTDCQSQGRALTLQSGKTVPMKCHWTGQAEIVVGGPLLILGGLMFANRRRGTLRSLSILGIVLGVFAVLLPTALIGVCASADMLCNSVMKPTLIFSGSLVTIASLVGLILNWGAEPRAMASASAS